jgi:hypothetical protein
MGGWASIILTTSYHFDCDKIGSRDTYRGSGQKFIALKAAFTSIR